MKDLRLWYQTPARDWETEALPIGNGRLGAMIYGGIRSERIQFNEETLFSGKPSKVDENAHLELEKIRKLLKEGNFAEAQRATETRFLKKASYGDKSDFGSYQNFGEIMITYPEGEEAVSHYLRELDISEAIAFVRYQCGRKHYRREYLSSYPDNVIAVRISCDEKQSVSLKITMVPGQEHTYVSAAQNDITLTGSVEYMDFEARLAVRCFGGVSTVEAGEIRIYKADWIELYLSAATEYQQNSSTYKGRDPKAYNSAVLEQALDKTWAEIRGRHVEDYQKLFGRVSLTLGREANGEEELPTDRRMEACRKGTVDRGLESLLFQYGRYLLISSSRPGTLPANLQGLWNNSNDPEWGSMFCYNINLNMNYWPAETTNLHECHEPMIRFIDDLRESGRKSARAYFNAGGWFASKKSDVWGFTQPYADAVNGLFIGGAGWLCQDVWEYYSFSGDTDYLRDTAYPILKECACFYLDYLTENVDGYLVSSPSTSPEHHFYFRGKPQSVSDGTEMDHRIVQELFTNCIRCSEILEIDETFRKLLKEKLEKLAPVKISADGKIQEWYRDFDYPEKQHRHLSHLYGLHPGQLIVPEEQPELEQAARESLNERGDGEKGWSRAWKINLWARLRDGNRAYRVLRGMMEESIYDNLFDTHPPFQIDGNLGYTAGVAEMLLQSRTDETGSLIILLPALPETWPEGQVSGLRTRGGFLVDMEWKGGQLSDAVLYGKPGQKGKVVYDGNELEFVISEEGKFLVERQKLIFVDSQP